MTIRPQACPPALNEVMSGGDRNVTPPDFRKDRQTALARELLKPMYQVYGFKSSDLLANLSEHFRNSAQIRYELLKLRAR